MRFHILGPLEVLRDGHPVDVGRPKQRAVLALLLISANRVLSVDRLISLLWDDEAPARATGVLQAYVSNLRRALEPARAAGAPAQLLVTQAPGYVLRVAPEDLDSARFEWLATRGHELLASGQPASARASLKEGLSLWRGPALAEYASERFAYAEAARLEALRTVAVEERLEADLALGAHGAAVAELESAVRDDPLRERAWGLLMLALYRSGQQAEALRAYTRARRVLAEEAGLEPSPMLRALEADVLAQSPSLDWRPPAPEDDAAPLTVATPPPSFPSSTLPDDRLVGRRPQLEVLAGALAQAEAGHGRVVLVSGEAGIGKTRLAEELAAQAEARGATVAWGRADETEGAPPWWPWVQVVRTLLATVDGHAATTALTGVEELGQLVPELKESLASGSPPPTPALGPAAARFRLYEAVAGLLLHVAARRPLVVLLDDLHWADPLSLYLLAHLGPRIGGAGILVVATYRHPEGADAGPVGDVLGELARLRTVERVAVPGLSEGEVGRFMLQAAGVEPTVEQVAAVHARTEGNPFFVAELARLLASEGTTATEAVPAGVRDVVRRRLARLPNQTGALLVVASVAGRDFDLAVVAAASQVDLNDAIGLIEAAVATGVVTEDAARPGHYRFSHAIVRDTVYGEISGLRRARLHGRVGRAVEALPDAEGRTSELANHFFRAAVVDGPAKGLEYALVAAEEAHSSLAYEQAEEHLRRAVELVSMLPPGPERRRYDLRVQNRLAVLLTVADGFTAPSATLGWDRASQLSADVDDGAQQLASEWGLLSLSCVRADVESTGRLGRQLLQRGSHPDQVASLMVGHFGLGRAALFYGDLAEALARFREARRLCDSLDRQARLDVFGWLDPAVLCRVNTAFVLSLLGEQDQAGDAVVEGLEVARRAGHPLSIGAALMFDAAVALLGGDAAQAHERSQRLHALAGRHGLPDFVAQAAIFGGWASSHLGDMEGGLAGIADGIATKRSAGFRMWQTIDLGLLADTLRRAGRARAALDAVDEAFVHIEGTGERFYEAELLRLRGELLRECRPEAEEEAATSLARAVAVATTQGARPFRRRAEAAVDRVRAEPAHT